MATPNSAPNLDGADSVERRATMSLEVRSDGENTVRVIGHAAVFNQETDIAGLFREVIRPGAFTEAIGRDDVPFLIEHSDLPLARTRSGTLRLSEDSVGLRIEAELDASDPDVQRIVPKMKRGDLDKMSFAFRATRQEWDETDPDDPLRVVRQADLYDVSIVTSPAYEGTDIALRSLADKRESDKQKEQAERQDKQANFEAARLRKKLAKKTKELSLRHRMRRPYPA